MEKKETKEEKIIKEIEGIIVKEEWKMEQSEKQSHP